MQKSMNIYFDKKLVNHIVYDMDYRERTATILKVDVIDDMYAYIPETGKENAYSLICCRAYLDKEEYFTDSITKFVAFEAFETLEETGGYYYNDKYSFWCDGGGTVKPRCYYGVQRKIFDDSYVKYTRQSEKAIASQLLAYSFLGQLGINRVKLLSFDVEDGSVMYARYVDKDHTCKSFYQLLLENFERDDFALASSHPLVTFSRLCEQGEYITDVVNFKEIFAQYLFLDSILLNEGHFLHNMMLGIDYYETKNEMYKAYIALPYTYTHTLGTEIDCELKDKARRAKGRMICDDFDLQALITRPFVTRQFKDVVVPVKEVMSILGEKDCMELCALLGYRYSILTDCQIQFDETLSIFSDTSK